VPSRGCRNESGSAAFSGAPTPPSTAIAANSEIVKRVEAAPAGFGAGSSGRLRAVESNQPVQNILLVEPNPIHDAATAITATPQPMTTGANRKFRRRKPGARGRTLSEERAERIF